PTYARASELFDHARHLYERGEYRSAADEFMASADQLRVARGQPYWEAMLRYRMAAYRNAAYAWAMARKRDEAKTRLLAGQGADGLAADDLRELLEHMPMSPPVDDRMR